MICNVLRVPLGASFSVDGRYRMMLRDIPRLRKLGKNLIIPKLDFTNIGDRDV